MARRTRRKAPTLEQVKRDLADLMEMAHHYAVEPFRQGEPVNPQELTRIMHAYVQAVGAYVKVTEAAELTERIEALERAMNEQGGRS